MTIMDGVQILILLIVILLLLKPFYTRWLPGKWHGLRHRMLPPRHLKYQGAWRRKTAHRENNK